MAVSDAWGKPKQGKPQHARLWYEIPQPGSQKGTEKITNQNFKNAMNNIKKKENDLFTKSLPFSELFQNNSLSLYRQPNMDLLLIYPLKIADTSVIYHSPFSGGDMIWLVIH